MMFLVITSVVSTSFLIGFLWTYYKSPVLYLVKDENNNRYQSLSNKKPKNKENIIDCFKVVNAFPYKLFDHIDNLQDIYDTVYFLNRCIYNAKVKNPFIKSHMTQGNYDNNTFNMAKLTLYVLELREEITTNVVEKFHSRCLFCVNNINSMCDKYTNYADDTKLSTDKARALHEHKCPEFHLKEIEEVKKYKQDKFLENGFDINGNYIIRLGETNE